MWEFYNDKVIFLTGGTGFVGTTILYRLFTQAAPRRVFVLTRGGHKNADEMWRKLLSESVSQYFIQNPRIRIVSGNLKAANLGLSDEDWECLKESVNIVIHTASAISLGGAHLGKISQLVVSPTMFLADIALQMPYLQHFVFVSTAYANTHLWTLSKKDEVTIEESFYSLDTGNLVSEPRSDSWEHISQGATDEWAEVQRKGTSKVWETFDFPWSYSYAKNLTERLLLQRFGENGAVQKLLIVKPSIISPAKSYPYQGYARASSTPAAGFQAAVNISFGRHFRFSSKASSPYESTLDEVPVDVVVDRLLVHLAYGTHGIVHAVSGKRDRLSVFNDIMPSIGKERRIPWRIKPECSSLDWHSKDVHPVNRIFKLVGTSFDFKEGKTEKLNAALSVQERSGLILFTDGYVPAIEQRRGIVREMGLVIGRKQHIPSFLVKLLFPSSTTRPEIPLPREHREED
ncbi:uncharacterized protein N7484_001500 [Penicillium longicatenatum]|uniref:uncharacterized protein n=1 Tax=Penicillium longicatenatum TaxID=1561947 RepID=UPI0025475BD7|nr:uncharacterized protein N7484_001500 [Penicillium longicatenatum]KAJ5657851.1 hypothetical protein N7484_001500 [Penicillium longicatenatum]